MRSVLNILPSRPAECALPDFVTDSFVGDVDTRNSFCIIASVRTCFVWKYAQLLPGVPTCYIFPCPNRYSEREVPFCALVSYGPSREPGLILLSQYGELRFWDSIGLGLTGGDATDDSLLDLRSDETLTGLIYAEVTCKHFLRILATDSSCCMNFPAAKIRSHNLHWPIVSVYCHHI